MRPYRLSSTIRVSRTTWARTPSRSGFSRSARRKHSSAETGFLQLQIGLAHARRRDEMIRIDFEGLMAVADRFDESAQGDVGDGPLMPGFGEPRRPLDQLGGPADGVVRAVCAALSRMIAPSSWRSASFPARAQMVRMPFSARVRTVRSSSSKAQPRVWLAS